MSSADTLSTISFKLRENSPWVIQRELVQQWNWWQQRCCSSAPSPWVIQLCSTNSTWRIATGSQFQGTDFQFQRRGEGVGIDGVVLWVILIPTGILPISEFCFRVITKHWSGIGLDQFHFQIRLNEALLGKKRRKRLLRRFSLSTFICTRRTV